MSKCCSLCSVFKKVQCCFFFRFCMQSVKVCSAAWRIKHSTVSLGVADRRCLLDCAISLFVSNIGFISILKTLIYAQDWEYSTAVMAWSLFDWTMITHLSGPINETFGPLHFFSLGTIFYEAEMFVLNFARHILLEVYANRLTAVSASVTSIYTNLAWHKCCYFAVNCELFWWIAN